MDDSQSLLKVTGLVAKPRDFTFTDLQQIPVEHQVPDFSSVIPERPGIALRLEGVLDAVGVEESAKFLGMHSSHDDFHASVPLAEVRERGFLIYGLEEAPLPQAKGGPIRFFIPDHAQCNTEEIDECANLKFVDHMGVHGRKRIRQSSYGRRRARKTARSR